MKKCKYFCKQRKPLRKLTVLLVLLMVSLMVFPAYAAETYWTNPITDQDMWGEIVPFGERYAYTYWESSASVTHIQGEETSLNGLRIFLNYTSDFLMEGYMEDLQPAWEEEGFIDYGGYMSTFALNPPYSIPANAPSGIYLISTKMNCQDAFFAVYNLDLGAPDLEVAGEFRGVIVPLGENGYRIFRAL